MPADGHSITDPFLYTTGPRDARIILVGEAWGRDELRERRPFVGMSGKELDRILFDAGLNRADILCANLVDSHPQSNDFTGFLEPNARGKDRNLRGVRAGQLLVQGHQKLLALIDRVKPSLVIGCGNWPLWVSKRTCRT